VKDMITFFGGLRFRYVDLFRVKCVPLLLGACADTLEGLRLYPTDPYGEESFRRGAVASELNLYFTESHEAVRQAFDLSRNSSLRTLETTALSITTAGDVASGFLKTVLSTIASPLPLELVINYGIFEVRCHRAAYIRIGIIKPNERAADTLIQQARFKVVSEMYAVRQFRLVLRAEGMDPYVQDAVRAIGCIVEEGRIDGKLYHLPCEPVIQ